MTVNRPRLRDIVRATCEAHRLTREQLIAGGGPVEDVVQARKVVCHLARKHRYPVIQIGAALDRDHSAITYFGSVLEREMGMRNRAELRKMVQRIENRAYDLTEAFWAQMCTLSKTQVPVGA